MSTSRSSNVSTFTYTDAYLIDTMHFMYRDTSRSICRYYIQCIHSRLWQWYEYMHIHLYLEIYLKYWQDTNVTSTAWLESVWNSCECNINILLCKYIYIYIFICINIYVWIGIYMHVYVCIISTYMSPYLWSSCIMHMLVHVSNSVCVYVCKYLNVAMFGNTYTYILIHMNI